MKKPSIWSALLKGVAGDTQLTSPAAGARPKVPSIELRDDWLSLTHPDFDGPAVLSLDKRWAVGYRTPSAAVGGRVQENGRVVLVDLQRNAVLHELTCFRRPMHAAVSNSGLYVVHDTDFGTKLQADLVVVSTSGEILVRRRYQANLFNLGLSGCGRYAVTQMCNAPDGPDGSKLEVLDIVTRKRLFSVLPPTGWADRYSFVVDGDGALEFLTVHFKNLGSFRYGANGIFLDPSALEDSRLTKGDYTQRILAAEEALKSDKSAAVANKALRAVESALAMGARERSDWAAVAYRVQGEAREALGQPQEALEAYRKALAANPKIGVKKKANAIEKKLFPTASK